MESPDLLAQAFEALAPAVVGVALSCCIGLQQIHLWVMQDL